VGVGVGKKKKLECLGGYGRTRTGLPVEDGREELRDQPLVIRLEFPGIDGFVGFGVQVVGVESPDGNQRLLICLVAQVAVRALPMPPREHAAVEMRNGIKPMEKDEKRRTGRSCGNESYEGQLRGDCIGSSTRCIGTAHEKGEGVNTSKNRRSGVQERGWMVL